MRLLCWPVSGLTKLFPRLPKRLFKALSGCRGNLSQTSVGYDRGPTLSLTVAGTAQVGRGSVEPPAPCFPLNCSA